MTPSYDSPDEGAPPSIAVIEAVARVERAEPADLSPLFETVDPEALDRLIEDGASVSFDYAGHRVNVSETGEISVQ